MRVDETGHDKPGRINHFVGGNILIALHDPTTMRHF